MTARRQRSTPQILVGIVVAGVVLAACSATSTASPSASSPVSRSTSASASGAATTGSAAGASQRGSTCPTSQPPSLAPGEQRIVTVTTKKGKFEITIEADLSPIAAGNFVALAQCGFYNGVVFHRLVPGFVIQGGDPTGTGTGGPGYEIKDEPVTGQYHRGTVAMARTSAPDSQGSQFFIVLDDQAAQGLVQANNYAIVGEVTSGMNVVDAIAAMPNAGPPNNEAVDPVAMDSVTVREP
jgi:cyclophilin family peptidyl-prolyl cis-trans isomerase